jgi:hypothetical protein
MKLILRKRYIKKTERSTNARVYKPSLLFTFSCGRTLPHQFHMPPGSKTQNEEHTKQTPGSEEEQAEVAKDWQAAEDADGHHMQQSNARTVAAAAVAPGVDPATDDSAYRKHQILEYRKAVNQHYALRPPAVAEENLEESAEHEAVAEDSPGENLEESAEHEAIAEDSPRETILYAQTQLFQPDSRPGSLAHDGLIYLRFIFAIASP